MSSGNNSNVLEFKKEFLKIKEKISSLEKSRNHQNSQDSEICKTNNLVFNNELSHEQVPSAQKKQTTSFVSHKKKSDFGVGNFHHEERSALNFLYKPKFKGYLKKQKGSQNKTLEFNGFIKQETNLVKLYTNSKIVDPSLDSKRFTKVMPINSSSKLLANVRKRV